MRLLIKNAMIYDTAAKAFLPGELFCAGGRIAVHGREDADSVIDAGGNLLIPGLIDIHTHGRAGYDFVTADSEGLAAMKKSYLDCGVTTVIPTLASATLDDWYAAFGRIDAARSLPGARFCGLHLEGRYLNPGKRGVQAAELLSRPDAEELRRIVGFSGLPLHVTYAPELDADGSFAETAVGLGVTLAAGHTAMSYDDAMIAESRGVGCYSHTFNAMPPLHHREGGPVAAALGGGKLFELICDGMHIVPHMVRLAYRCGGNERLVLVSDSMEGAGAPDGEYHIAGVPVTVRGGRALSADGTLGGSTLDEFGALMNLMRFCNIPLETALPCATINPARAMGIDGEVGSLEVGKLADALLLCRDGDSYSIGMKLLGGEEV